MPDSPNDKPQTRDKGLLASLRDLNKLREQSAEIGNQFFEKSTEHNGPADAMRHIIFNAKLTAGTGSTTIPWLLDKLHEYGETYLTGQPKKEMEMDLANGEIGRAIGKLNLTDAEMDDLAQRAVQGGKAATLSQKEQQQKYATGGGVIVDEDGKPISTPLEEEVQQQFGLEPNLDRATLIPYKDPKKGWIAPEAIYQAAKLLASPIAALHGKYISPEEGVEGALTLGSPTTAAGLLSKAEPATARMFIGRSSRAWNPESHALALKMKDEGASPRTIWEQTMNWLTPEGRWAQEISDKEASYSPENMLAAAKAKYKTETAAWKAQAKPYEEARNIHLKYAGLQQAEPNPFVERYTEGPAIGMERYHPQTGMPLIKEGMEDDYMNFRQGLKEKALQQYAEQTGKPVSEDVNWIFRTTPLWQIEGKLNEVNPYMRPSEKTVRALPMSQAIEHPALYEAYPSIGAYPFNVKAKSLMKGAEASFNPSTKEVSLSAVAQAPRKSLLHELQHAVQEREGWEGGASPSQFAPLPSNISNQLYLRNLGEGMARATEARKDLTMAQRNAIFPAESFSLPRVSPATTMEQFMWKGMDTDKKRAIVDYLNNNMDELTWKGRMTGKDVDIPLAYDPEKVQSIVESLSTDYQGSHKPSGPDFGAPLHDMTKLYPDDIYSKDAVRFYGTGRDPATVKMDTDSVRKAQSFRNKPDATVEIYRAVPNDPNINIINAGDWVTLNKDYAKRHGDSVLYGDYKILSQKVKAKDLFTPADSIHEWGYFPEGQEVKKAEGGSVNFPDSDTPDQKYTDTMGQEYADANVVGYAEGGDVNKRLAYVSGKQDDDMDAYHQWLKDNGITESDDYDTLAAFKAGLMPDERGHLKDTYKKPNHITYSIESVYSKGKDAPPAGEWTGDDESGWQFHATTTNILNAGDVEKLKKYFAEKEPNVKLVLPLAYKPAYADGGLVAPTAQMSYDPTRVQSIADQLRQDMYNG